MTMMHQGSNRTARPCFAVIVMLLLASLPACAQTGQAQPQTSRENVAVTEPGAISERAVSGGFALFEPGEVTTILVDPAEDPGILRAVRNLQADLEARGPSRPEIRTGLPKETGPLIVVGSLDKSRWLSEFTADGAVSTEGLAGEWEAFSQEVVETPFEGIDRALVIAGADKRGTIFGVYDLLDRAGVSPWAWWADVPIEKTDQLYVAPGRRLEMPSVKYRGIFLNDENPALFGWVNATFGGFNHDFYERVFELILRQKGNYLWPAMWGKAFYDDDPMNAVLADEMGVVIGTSHHEPLGRAHIEWERYGEGDWNYTTNAGELQDFWRSGMERIGEREALVTIGMRGDGDEAMSEGTAIDLLETIVADQRAIIEEVTGEPASDQPQVWALYKEVQDYYDQGMNVPDDVTLLFADDNWGNIRRLPALGEERPGGYGVYYHFDYVGGPRNHKWINTTQIERVREQMSLASEYGAEEIWVVNVGDLKPMELPISFFMDYAWAPSDWPVDRTSKYTEEWAADQFPDELAGEIADLLDTYTKYNARRKPELLDEDTYSVVNFEEFGQVHADYTQLAERAETLRQRLPEAYDDAFVQLVWFPVTASANLYTLYYNTALNQLHAEQGRADTNQLADNVEQAFARDDQLRRVYEEEIADGKWVSMMSQVHIGYTYWQQPEEQTMPEVARIEVPDAAGFGLAVPGRRENVASAGQPVSLPPLSVFQPDMLSGKLEIFNTGRTPYTVDILPGEPFVHVAIKGEEKRQLQLDIETGQRLQFAIDWKQVPEGRTTVPITIDAGALGETTLELPLYKPEAASTVDGLVAINGYVSAEAAEATRRVEGEGLRWETLPNLGRVGDSVTSLPVTAEASEPGGNSPRLEFDVHLFEAGEVNLTVTMAPTQDFLGQGGLRYAVSIDDGAPVMVNLNEGDSAGEGNLDWETAVAGYAYERTTTLMVDEPGPHTVKLWRVDPGVIFQRILVATGDVPESYLGPPVTPRCTPSDGPLPDCVIPGTMFPTQ